MKPVIKIAILLFYTLFAVSCCGVTYSDSIPTTSIAPETPTATYSPTETPAIVMPTVTATATAIKQLYCDYLSIAYAPQDGFETYCDQRYEFAIDYPATWKQSIEVAYPWGMDNPDSRDETIRFSNIEGAGSVIELRTYRLSKPLKAVIEQSWAFPERAFDPFEYPRMVIGGRDAYALMNQSVQDVNFIQAFIEIEEYYAIIRLSINTRAGLDAYWEMLRSIQAQGMGLAENAIPDEIINDSYTLLP